MPWRSLVALPLLAVALPAAAQTKLAQPCAAFGEAQYRKLSPSVDRVTALDFPPPALERVDAKVGSQATAAAPGGRRAGPGAAGGGRRPDGGPERLGDVRGELWRTRDRAGLGHQRAGVAPGGGRDSGLSGAVRPA